MIVPTSVAGVDLLPGSESMEDVNEPKPTGNPCQTAIRDFVAEARDDYDVILVDCPPSMHRPTRSGAREEFLLHDGTRVVVTGPAVAAGREAVSVVLKKALKQSHERADDAGQGQGRLSRALPAGRGRGPAEGSVGARNLSPDDRSSCPEPAARDESPRRRGGPPGYGEQRPPNPPAALRPGLKPPRPVA